MIFAADRIKGELTGILNMKKTILLWIGFLSIPINGKAQFMPYDTLPLTLDYITCLAADSGGTVYATDLGNICRSTDNGDHWTACASVPSDIATLNYAPDSSLIVTRVNRTSHLGDVWRSRDSGKSWKFILDDYAEDIQFDHNGGIYLGMVYSTNDGNSWSLAATSKLRGVPYVTALSPSGALITCTDSGIGNANIGLYRSTNKGSSWLMSGLYYKNGSLAHIPDKRFCKFVSTEKDMYLSDHYGGCLYKSTDDGISFEAIAVGPVFMEEVFAATNNSNLYISRDSSLYCSMDGGNNWRLLAQFPENITVFAVSSDLVFIGTERKNSIYRLRIK